jgi:uncharacterized membrane protein
MAGTITGVALSLVLAILKYTTKLINREYRDITILSVAIGAGIFFCLLAWTLSHQKSSALREKLTFITGTVLSATLLLYVLPDVLLYPTEFALAGESIFSTDFLFKMIGFLGGLLIVILAALATRQAALNVSPRLLCVLLTLGLFINMLNQASTIVQFLLARRIIPMMHWLFSLIKLTTNYSNWFLYGIMVVTIVIPVVVWLRNLRPQATYSNPAQWRKIRAVARNRRRWCMVMLVVYVLSVFSLTALKSFDQREVVLSPAEPMNIVGTEIMIPLEMVSDGHLHRFAYTAENGTEVRFIVIMKNSIAFGVGLDACDICGQTGYYERDDKVICKLCDVVMNKSTIGFTGGCNPVPLAYVLRDGGMIIQTQDLENERKRFE